MKGMGCQRRHSFVTLTLACIIWKEGRGGEELRWIGRLSLPPRLLTKVLQHISDHVKVVASFKSCQIQGCVPPTLPLLSALQFHSNFAPLVGVTDLGLFSKNIFYAFPKVQKKFFTFVAVFQPLTFERKTQNIKM